MAYFLLRTHYKHEKWGEVVEYAGDRNLVAGGLYLMLVRRALNRIQVHAPLGDPIIWYLWDLQARINNENQQGTVKIVDYPSLIKDLTPYFSQYTPHEFLSSFCVDEKNGHISFALQGERFISESADFIPQLFFGFRNKKELPKYLRGQGKHQQVLKEFIKSVFPIPLPWTANMNYV
jgi:hypothetical protein